MSNRLALTVFRSDSMEEKQKHLSFVLSVIEGDLAKFGLSLLEAQKGMTDGPSVYTRYGSVFTNVPDSLKSHEIVKGMMQIADWKFPPCAVYEFRARSFRRPSCEDCEKLVVEAFALPFEHIYPFKLFIRFCEIEEDKGFFFWKLFGDYYWAEAGHGPDERWAVVNVTEKFCKRSVRSLPMRFNNRRERVKDAVSRALNQGNQDMAVLLEFEDDVALTMREVMTMEQFQNRFVDHVYRWMNDIMGLPLDIFGDFVEQLVRTMSLEEAFALGNDSGLSRAVKLVQGTSLIKVFALQALQHLFRPAEE